MTVSGKSGIHFIDKKLLSPLSDTDEDNITIWERNGGNVLAVKVGMELAALVMPYHMINPAFSAYLTEIAREVKMQIKKSEENE